MKKVDIGQAATILANIGVIAGIALLAIELQQNNELLRTQQQFNRLSVVIGTATLLAENPELSKVIAKVNASKKDIFEIDFTPGEMTQVAGYYTRILDNQEWTYLEMSREDLPIQRWREMARSNGWQNGWKHLKAKYDLGFAEWMEENVVGQ